MSHINRNKETYKYNLGDEVPTKSFTNNLFKLITGLFDKYGIMLVDMSGEVLGLNKNGKQISNQNIQELSESLKDLSEKLKDPAVVNVLIETIKDTEPIIKEVVLSIANLVTSTGKFVVKDIITFICHDTPAAPICGLFKLADNSIVFGQELVDGARTTLDSVKKSQYIGTNLLENISNLAKDNLEKVQDKIQENLHKVEDNVATGVKDKINNIENKISNYSNNNIQKGGLKKIYKEKKTIENRINQSLQEFLYLKPKEKSNSFRSQKNNRKTKRIR